MTTDLKSISVWMERLLHGLLVPWALVCALSCLLWPSYAQAANRLRRHR